MGVIDPRMPYGETRTASGRIKYPNPFFDMSKTYTPKNIKTLFGYARHFFYKNDLLNTIIMKLVTYPITDLLLEAPDVNVELNPETKHQYKEAFYHTWQVKKMLVEIGLDYHVFGNCFISANRIFKRFLICANCKTEHLVSDLSTKDVKFTNFSYQGTCPACKHGNVIFKINDQYQNNHKGLKFIRWVPETIEIEFDPLTGEHKYFYLLIDKVRKGITAGDRVMVDNFPELYIQAIKENKKIELDKRNFYHFKRPTLADAEMGWGKPSILPAMSLIWYMQTLRRANEAIASEHIVPWRILYPTGTGTDGPWATINMGKWRDTIQNNLKEWKLDPNYVAVMPIPMGYQSIGGDARMTLVTPEVKALEESIARSMGIPWEFIAGGASWTGSSVSLRIVENYFLSYREMLVDFMNYFLIPIVASVTGWPKIVVRFREFRMSDDSETKAQIMQLNQEGKLSDTSSLDFLGFDSAADRENKISELEFESSMLNKRTKAQAQAQASASEMQMRSQAKAEWAYLDEKSRIYEQEFADELGEEQTKALPDNTLDVFATNMKFAVQIAFAPEESQQELLEQLARLMPLTYQCVMKRIPLIMQSLMMAVPTLTEQAQQQNELETKKQQGGTSSSTPKKKKPTSESSTKHTAPKKGNP